MAEVLAATGGALVREGRGEARGGTGPSCVGVSTDTRAIHAGSTEGDGPVFVALSGERFDGHDHLESAARAGAGILVVARECNVLPGPAVVRVDDTLVALGHLARAHRRRWARGGGAARPRKVVAVTGSAGKTTTRRAIAALLEAAGASVLATGHNFNNRVGVPLTLLGLSDAHDTAVIEIGTNQRGEIAAGAEIAEPDVGVLTLVAEAHGEGLGSAWAIAVEKGDLLAALPPSGVAIVNGDDARAAAQLLRSRAGTWLRYGEEPSCDVALVARELHGVRGQRLSVRVLGRRPVIRPLVEVDVAMLGKAGVSATLAALAAADAVLDAGAPSGEVATRALGGAAAREPGRLSPIARADGAIVLDDAYNANPASMLASIETAREIARAEGRALVLILGEMYELGAQAEALHEQVGRAAAMARPRALLAVSGLASKYAESAKRYGVAFELLPDAAAATRAARALVAAGDLVLVKGSHGVGLGPLAAELMTAIGAPT